MDKKLTCEEFYKALTKAVNEKLGKEPWFIKIHEEIFSDLFDSYSVDACTFDDALQLVIDEVYFYDGPEEWDK